MAACAQARVEMNVSDDPVKGFLGRWSRLKREAAAADAVTPVPPAVKPPEADAANAAAPLPSAAPALTEDAAPPPLESLGFDSDYRAFLGQKVDEGLKRAALKKLFHTPHFNTMDGLDVYIEDFNLYEPLPASMVSQLAHAKETLNPTLPADWLTATPDSPSSADAAELPVAPTDDRDAAGTTAAVEGGEAGADDPEALPRVGTDDNARAVQPVSSAEVSQGVVSPGVEGSHSGSE